MTRSPSRRRGPALLAAVAALALGVAACSSDGSDRADRSTTTSGRASDATTTVATDDEASATAAGPGEVATADPVPSAGCGSAATEPVHRERVPVGDADRFYLLSTPADVSDPDRPLPLVLDLHGLVEGAEVHARNSELDGFAADHGFVVAFPHGTGTPVGWNTDVDPEANPDLRYLDAVLDQIEAQQCIDTSRVYSTGLSNGAFLTSVVGCALTDRVAAIAPVAGLLFPDGCTPSRPLPVLTFHGTGDPILLFNGGVGDRLGSILNPDPNTPEAPLPPADVGPDAEGYLAAARSWAEADGCDPEPVDTAITDAVTQRTWACPPGAAVEFDIIDGGGHTWPGSPFSGPLEAIMGSTDQSIDANAVLWAFFQRFALPAS